MINIKLISLNICNDDDLIYGTSHIKSNDILQFIDYHKITDDMLILDLKKLYNNKMSIFDNDKFDINNTNMDYLHKSIISFHMFENKLRSITVKVPFFNDYKIRYVNNLDHETVDLFMYRKKLKLIESIKEYDADFIGLQELDLHNLPTDNDQFRELLNSSYNMISPLDLNDNNKIMLTGMTTNYILYKKEHYLLESSLKEYGITGLFLIDGKILKFISGRWMPLKLNKDIRLTQYAHLDSDVKANDHIVFMGDTNLRSYEMIKTNFLKDVIINKPNRSYTINKYINEYFMNDYKYLARYDRIFTYGVTPLNTDFAFYKPDQELKNKYRKSGNISDHFGLITEIIL